MKNFLLKTVNKITFFLPLIGIALGILDLSTACLGAALFLAFAVFSLVILMDNKLRVIFFITGMFVAVVGGLLEAYGFNLFVCISAQLLILIINTGVFLITEKQILETTN